MGCDEYDFGKAAGRGKFSTVYRAKRKRDGKTVAIKKIEVNVMDQSELDTCLREVHLLESVCVHPNVISYYDSFLEESAMYVVLEWAHAGDLKRQIRKARDKGARFDEALIWKIFAQIADAVRHMHRKRTMHRDLKPANIFLSQDGTVKVGDLGLGRFLSDHTLEAFTKVGTPLYMSPEILTAENGRGYTFSTDVYSLGCILYELAMLRAPFKEPGMNFKELCRRVIRGDYTPVPDVYSRELRDLIDGMLGTDPETRPDMDSIVDVAISMNEASGGAASAGGKSGGGGARSSSAGGKGGEPEGKSAGRRK